MRTDDHFVGLLTDPVEEQALLLCSLGLSRGEGSRSFGRWPGSEGEPEKKYVHDRFPQNDKAKRAKTGAIEWQKPSPG
jgi:hypothetical protein